MWPTCLSLSALLVVLRGRASCAVTTAAARPQEPGVEIGELVSRIQAGLTEAQRDLDEQRIPLLESVTLNLVAEAGDAGGGQADRLIVSAGKRRERSRPREIEVTLTPPTTRQLRLFTKAPSVGQQLATAIVSAARGVQEARNRQDVPLVASALKVVINFVVKRDASGEGDFEIVPVTFGMSGDLAATAMHKITLLFQDPKAT